MTSELTPPDYTRCQAVITTRLGAFRMGGPTNTTEQCSAVPVWLAVEIKPGKDGLHGSMTLCHDCAKVMMEDADLRSRVQLQPILNDEKGTE